MSFEKLEGSKWVKWPTKESAVGEIKTGKVIQLSEGKYGPMCLIENEEGSFLMAGKSFYGSVTAPHQEDEPVEWRIKLGDVLRVTYEKDIPTDKGNPMRNMIVEIDK